MEPIISEKENSISIFLLINTSESLHFHVVVRIKTPVVTRCLSFCTSTVQTNTDHRHESIALRLWFWLPDHCAWLPSLHAQPRNQDERACLVPSAAEKHGPARPSCTLLPSLCYTGPQSSFGWTQEQAQEDCPAQQRLLI